MKGVLLDKIEFKTDKIFLSHNQVIKHLIDFQDLLEFLISSINIGPSFKNDISNRRINFSFLFSKGIYLYNNVLAILSVQHQTVHVYRYSREGEFLPLLKIGRLLYDDDEFLLNRTGQVNFD